MKIIILLSIFMNATLLFSQELSTKYGKITTDELKMTSCSLDSTANAVVIYKKGKTQYEYKDGFRIKHEIETKIKILTHEGTSYANVIIPYYNESSVNGMKENVSQIEGYAFNLENGKIVKTKLEKDFITKERINDKYMQVKFSIPNVKAGTVIEYKYEYLSDFYHLLEDWEMQQDIPVLYGEYDLSIPNYYRFNMSTWGVHKIDYTTSSKTMHAEVKSGHLGTVSNSVRVPVTNYVFTAKELPPLKDESYLWCADDYRTKVNFELLGIQFPGSEFKPFTNTWEDVDNTLIKHERFGGMLKIDNPFLEKMKELDYKTSDQLEKIALTYQLLKKNISWDGTYRLYGKSLNEILKKGEGSNADINFILIRMLRDAGYLAYPVVISRRDRGTIPEVYPSLNKINTFVVAIKGEDNKYLFLDGSVNNGYIDILPPVLMATKGRIISSNPNGEKWVQLSNLGNNHLKSSIIAKLNENGLITGNRTINYSGQYSSVIHKEASGKDTISLIEKAENEHNIQILKYSQTGLTEFCPNVQEFYEFEKQITTNNNFIYLNPLIFPHKTSNPFIQADRKLPVEFPFPESVTFAVSLELPEGYIVEEMPKAATITIGDGLATCRYMAQIQNNKVNLIYRYNLKNILYTKELYGPLQEFWAILVDRNNQMIVLKKEE